MQKPVMSDAERIRRRQTGLRAHAAADSLVLAFLIAVWAITSRGYFWPVWVLLPLALALAIHGWFVLLGEHREWVTLHFRGSRGSRASPGSGARSSCT